jgi:hypothetical protein
VAVRALITPRPRMSADDEAAFDRAWKDGDAFGLAEITAGSICPRRT